jgi:O-antigen/teichoic acid export membrane protein
VSNAARANGPRDPSPTPSLKRGFLWVSAGHGIYIAGQWLMLMVIARVTDVSTVGQYGFALAVCTPVAVLANLGLRVGQATDARRDFTFGTYRAICLLGGVATILGCGMIGGVAALAGNSELGLVVVLVAVTKAVEFQSLLYYGLFQQRDQMNLVARSLIFRSLLGAGGLALASYLTSALVPGLLAQAVAWTLVLMVHDDSSARRLLADTGRGATRPDWSSASLLRLFRVSWPLGLSGCLIALRQGAPRYTIQILAGSEATGLYTVAHYFMHAALQLVTALGHTASARLARFFASGAHAAFTGLVVKLVLLGGSVGLALTVLSLLFGRVMLALVFGEDYIAAHTLLVVLMAALVVQLPATLLQFSIDASRRFGINLAIQVILLVAILVLSGSLTATIGAIGAAWSVFIVALGHLSMGVVVSWRLASKLRTAAPAA